MAPYYAQQQQQQQPYYPHQAPLTTYPQQSPLTAYPQQQQQQQQHQSEQAALIKQLADSQAAMMKMLEQQQSFMQRQAPVYQQQQQQQPLYQEPQVAFIQPYQQQFKQQQQETYAIPAHSSAELMNPSLATSASKHAVRAYKQKLSEAERAADAVGAVSNQYQVAQQATRVLAPELEGVYERQSKRVNRAPPMYGYGYGIETHRPSVLVNASGLSDHDTPKYDKAALMAEFGNYRRACGSTEGQGIGRDKSGNAIYGQITHNPSSASAIRSISAYQNIVGTS
jgi:hypothetical protein